MSYKDESELIRMAISSLAADKMGEHIYLLEEKINRVRDLHIPDYDNECQHCIKGFDYDTNNQINYAYPCPTIEALEGENNE